MKTKIVPASELSTKTLRASDYVGVPRKGLKRRYEVDIDPDSVSVCINRVDETGVHEMVLWNRKEWEEDPDVVFAIVRAIVLALNIPRKADEVFRKLGKL